MKLSTVLKALLVILPSAATYAAGIATGTNGQPDGAILLQIAGVRRVVRQDEVPAQLATNCPNDVEAAISCFQMKDYIASVAPLDALNEDVERSNLVAIARFIGEIRSRRTLNYKNLQVSGNSPFLQSVRISGTNVFNPGASTDPEVKKAYEKAFAELELQNKTFRLQQQLDMLDVHLTHRLLDACSRLPTNDSANVELIKQVSDAADLTEDERKKP